MKNFIDSFKNAVSVYMDNHKHYPISASVSMQDFVDLDTAGAITRGSMNKDIAYLNFVEINIDDGLKQNEFYLVGPNTIEYFTVDDSDCCHNWKTYVGFTESYEFCTLCNKKRQLMNTKKAQDDHETIVF